MDLLFKLAVHTVFFFSVRGFAPDILCTKSGQNQGFFWVFGASPRTINLNRTANSCLFYRVSGASPGQIKCFSTYRPILIGHRGFEPWELWGVQLLSPARYVLILTANRIQSGTSISLIKYYQKLPWKWKIGQLAYICGGLRTWQKMMNFQTSFW